MGLSKEHLLKQIKLKCYHRWKERLHLFSRKSIYKSMRYRWVIQLHKEWNKVWQDHSKMCKRVFKNVILFMKSEVRDGQWTTKTWECILTELVVQTILLEMHRICTQMTQTCIWSKDTTRPIRGEISRLVEMQLTKRISTINTEDTTERLLALISKIRMQCSNVVWTSIRMEKFTTANVLISREIQLLRSQTNNR